MNKLGLPLKPTICTAEQLGERVPSRALVLATGRYRGGTPPPNFDGVQLSGSVFYDRVAKGLPDGKFRVLGFYGRRERRPDRPPIVGYNGPWVDVLEMEPVGAV